MNKVSIILKNKSGNVYTLSKEDTVKKALDVMKESNIGSVLITEDGSLIGIFTERDMARRVAYVDDCVDDITLADVMTSDVFTVTPNHNANDCMTIMTEKRVRHLPVVDNGEIVGVLSIGDIVKDIIEELEFLCVQLEGYIQGLR